MSIGISVEHLVAHVHTQNGLTESFIKRLQLTTRPLLMRVKLPTFLWELNSLCLQLTARSLLMRVKLPTSV